MNACMGLKNDHLKLVNFIRAQTLDQLALMYLQDVKVAERCFHNEVEKIYI